MQTQSPPLSPVVEGEWMADVEWTSRWARHNKTGLRLHISKVSVPTGRGQSIYNNSHLSGHLLALPTEKNTSKSSRCSCKVLSTVSFSILTKPNESKPENACKRKKVAYCPHLWMSQRRVVVTRHLLLPFLVSKKMVKWRLLFCSNAERERPCYF